jgi:mersacidin/lichenicidin family type 2 lantibiotic
MTLTDKIRAWREPAFRNTLSEAERMQLENPAGMIELTGTALDVVAGGSGKKSRGRGRGRCHGKGGGRGGSGSGSNGKGSGSGGGKGHKGGGGSS